MNGIDKFLFFGSPKPTRVQSMGAWLIGLMFILVGGVLLVDSKNDSSVFGVLASWPIIYLGGLAFRNGFPRSNASQNTVIGIDRPKRSHAGPTPRHVDSLTDPSKK